MEGQAAEGQAEVLVTTEAIISVAILLAVVLIFSAFLGQSERQSAPPFRAFRIGVGIAIGVQWVFVYHASNVLPVRALYPVAERYGRVRLIITFTRGRPAPSRTGANDPSLSLFALRAGSRLTQMIPLSPSLLCV